MDWNHLLPEAILSVGGTMLLIIGAVNGGRAMRDLLRWLTFALLFSAAAALVVAPGLVNHHYSDAWTNITPATSTFAVALLGLLGWVTLCSKAPDNGAGEWFSLILFTGVGTLVLSRVANLAGFFLGIEVLSLALYVLVAFVYGSRNSLRAGAMYLVLAGFASSFLVFGMALVYAVYGTLSIKSLATMATTGSMPPLAMIGYGIFLVGVGFKLAIVPFHMWAPDIYEGTTGPVAGVIASVSKGATLAAIFPFLFLLKPLGWVFIILIGATMLIGNILGLRETRVKRILAYSSIAHIGYMLLAYISSSIEPVIFYVVAYGISVLGAFTVLSGIRPERAVTLNDLHGSARRHPVLSACMIAFVISLAGLPLSVGFWGKLFLFSAAFNAGFTKLAILGLISSAIGIFYYLRILVHMFMVAPEMNPRGEAVLPSHFETAMIIISAVGVVVLGVFPNWLLHLIHLHV